MSRQWLIEHAAQQLREEQDSTHVACKICSGPSHRYDILDFERSAQHAPFASPPSGIPVVYRRCEACGFIFSRFFDSFTAEQWREHVYNDDYARVDPEWSGARSVRNARAIAAYFGGMREKAIGLDYGGG